MKDEYLVSHEAGRFEKRKERHTEGQQEGRFQKIDERCQAYYHSSLSSVHLEKFVPFDDWVASNRCDKSGHQAVRTFHLQTAFESGSRAPAPVKVA